MHGETNIIVNENDIGKRVDRFLAEQLPHLSRVRIQTLIKQGNITHNGSTIKSLSKKTVECDSFIVVEPPINPTTNQPQNIPLDVMFEDEHIIVINKPAGMVVHPDNVHKDGTLVNALLYHCAGKLSGIGGEERPGIIHRLDMDTSGLLVCAKTQKAHVGLAKQFAAHGNDGKLTRAYFALVWGKPPPGPEIIDSPIGRHRLQRHKMAILKFGGRSAKTKFSLVERVGEKASLVRCQLFTGRTHQIRVHLLSRGWAVIGDKVYYLRKNNFISVIERQALHATHLGFIHPENKKALQFNSPPPADFEAATKKLHEAYPLI